MTSATSAFAFGDDNGRYQVTDLGGGQDKWVVIDTQTGKTRWCYRRSVSLSEEPEKPMCGPWSVPEEYNLWPSGE